MGPNTVELDYRFCLLFSFCGYLKMNLSGSFAFSAVLLSLLVPDIFFLWWIAVDPPQFTSSQFPACSSISLYLLKFLYGPIFLWQNIDPCSPTLLPSKLPFMLATSWHQQYVLLTTHCSSKYWISISERWSFLPSHLTTVVPSGLAGNSSGKKLSYSGKLPDLLKWAPETYNTQWLTPWYYLFETNNSALHKQLRFLDVFSIYFFPAILSSDILFYLCHLA